MSVTIDGTNGLTLPDGNTVAVCYSGTYTPTITAVSNVSSPSAYGCQYLRVGNTVTVSGALICTFSTAASGTLGISLPIASNLSGTGPNCSGTSNNTTGAYPGVVYGDSTNKRAQLVTGTSNGSLMIHYFQFTYVVN